LAFSFNSNWFDYSDNVLKDWNYSPHVSIPTGSITVVCPDAYAL